MGKRIIKADDLLKETVYLDYDGLVKIAFVRIDENNVIDRYFLKNNYKDGEEINSINYLQVLNEELYQELISNQDKIKEFHEANKRFQEKQEERKLKEEQEENKRLKKENFCNGFTNNLSPMRKQNILDVLNKQYRYDGTIRTRKDNTLFLLRKGYLPIIKDKLYWVKERNDWYGYDEIEKSKDIYCLEDSNKTYYEITKTEFDYANYLLKIGLDNAKLSNEI